MLSFGISAIVFMTSFLLVLSFLVFFHELGHYSVARMFGTAVERFSIGFGKPIFQRTAKSGTNWSIGRFPLGGYVKFLGDAGAASNPDTEQLEEIRAQLEADGQASNLESCFHFKPLWQRALIVLAGPVANFILAILIFAIIALSFGTSETKSVVNQVLPGGAAESAGVQVGDQFLTLNGKDVSLSQDLISYISIRSNVDMLAEIDRGGDIVELTLTPERKAKKDFIGGINEIGIIGVGIGHQDHYEIIDHNPVTALGYGWNQFTGTISTTGAYIGRIFQGKEDGRAFGGPIRIATITGKSAVDIVKDDLTASETIKRMFLTLFSLAGALSIGLGVANLMPIPALDGGHLLYYGYEAIAGKPLSEQKQEYGFRIGFAVILTLLIYLTINDFGYVQSMSS